MVDHSPPRDARKRKFQKLDRVPGGQNRGIVGSKVPTTPRGPVAPHNTPKSQPISTYVGRDERGKPESLPVKNKVGTCLFL